MWRIFGETFPDLAKLLLTVPLPRYPIERGTDVVEFRENFKKDYRTYTNRMLYNHYLSFILCSAGTGISILAAQAFLRQNKELLRTPLLLLQSNDDKLVDTKRTQKCFESIDRIKDKTFIIYEGKKKIRNYSFIGQHFFFFEKKNHYLVVSDIVNWLDDHLE